MAVRATTKGCLTGDRGPKRLIGCGFEARMEHRLKKYRKTNFLRSLVNLPLVMTWVNVKNQICEEEMSKGVLRGRGRRRCAYEVVGKGDESWVGSWEEAV